MYPRLYCLLSFLKPFFDYLYSLSFPDSVRLHRLEYLNSLSSYPSELSPLYLRRRHLSDYLDRFYILDL